MRVRLFPEANYQAYYTNGHTLRCPVDQTKPVKGLKYPEFYDVKITDQCFGGCPYCYQASTAKDAHYLNVPQKIRKFFGPMSMNQRPFQVAIGGGEPTLHPEFREICATFKELGIDPNYTTNGMNLTPEVLQTTEEFVNGVAVSTHQHLNWRKGVKQLTDRGIYTNLHIIISDAKSVLEFAKIYEEFKDVIKYFVLLPLVDQGRSTKKFGCWSVLRKYLDSLEDRSQIAFGAMFHPYLGGTSWDISIYEPEAFSRYLVMNNTIDQYPSSFSTTKRDLL